MRSGSLQVSVAAALFIAAGGAQAQRGSANHPPPTTAQLIDRAATDAAQAQALAAAPYGQPASPEVKEPVAKPRRSSFDPNAIHYPYGRASLGTIDPNSAANPYGPYARDPGLVGPALLPPLRAGTPGLRH